MKKKIILAMPRDFELHFLIQRNLIHLGFEVVTIFPNYNHEFTYPTLFHRFYNAYRKIFYKDKTYKKKLTLKNDLEIINNKLATNSIFDYALFIRADFFDIEIIKLVKQNSQKLYSYHYDGLQRNPETFNIIPFFEKFYVFDALDLKNNSHTLFPCTNFYFDYDMVSKFEKKEKIDIYFLGSYHESRIKKLYEFNDLFSSKMNLNIDIVLNKEKWKTAERINCNSINYLKKIVPFEEYISKIESSKIIIDFVIDEHHGLSFRVFESIKYGKKLITNNNNIREYDFYNSNNIFVIENDNYTGIEEFFNIQYEELPQNIYEKYSFTNWINYILEIEPNQVLKIH